MYSVSSGSAECTRCDYGKYNPSPSADSCLSCPAGSISTPLRDVCLACSLGTYTSVNRDKCIQCGVGKYAASASSPGSDPSFCLPCPLGTYSETMALHDKDKGCLPCSIGKYNNQLGSSEPCKDCPTGSLSSNAGQATCTACTLGKFQPLIGRSNCYDCPIGSNSEKESASEYCFVENKNGHPYYGNMIDSKKINIQSSMFTLQFRFEYDARTNIHPNDVLYYTTLDSQGDAFYYFGRNSPTNQPVTARPTVRNSPTIRPSLTPKPSQSPTFASSTGQSNGWPLYEQPDSFNSPCIQGLECGIFISYQATSGNPSTMWGYGYGFLRKSLDDTDDQLIFLINTTIVSVEANSTIEDDISKIESKFKDSTCIFPRCFVGRIAKVFAFLFGFYRVGRIV